MQRIPPELTSNARRLRSEATDAEWRLWQDLRAMRSRFTRQLVISHFIADFACRSLRLIIELDGGQHASAMAEDAARTAYLEAHGWQVLRFWNNTVFENREHVLDTIMSAMAARMATHPQPLPSREGR